jgi:hypothetical protein
MRAAAFRFRIYLIILASVFLAGSVGFIVIEGLSPLDAAYFLIVTIATVGYGDIHPVTPEGRALAIFVIIAGVGSFIAVAADGIEMMIVQREERVRGRKVAMIIGVFFAEAGVHLLRTCRKAVIDIDSVRNDLLVKSDWDAARFSTAKAHLSSHKFPVDIHRVDLLALKHFLGARRSFFIQLLQHPALFEHEDFTDLITAVFHLEEELIARDDFSTLPESDYAHLSSDLLRVFGHLVLRWLDHMGHLQEHYPYLFSLAVRTNPFDPDASPIITG